MKFPNDFGMKEAQANARKKQPAKRTPAPTASPQKQRGSTWSDNLLVMGLFAFGMVGIVGFGTVSLDSFKNLQASTIQMVEQQTEAVAQQALVKEVAGEKVSTNLTDINRTLMAMLERIPNGGNDHEFLLIRDVPGSTPFTIPAGTCANGIRVIARHTTPTTGDATLKIAGLIPGEAGEAMAVYADEPAFSQAIPIQMRNLPSSLQFEQRTVFPTYAIQPGTASQLLEYKISCY